MMDTSFFSDRFVYLIVVLNIMFFGCFQVFVDSFASLILFQTCISSAMILPERRSTICFQAQVVCHMMF